MRLEMDLLHVKVTLARPYGIFLDKVTSLRRREQLLVDKVLVGLGRVVAQPVDAESRRRKIIVRVAEEADLRGAWITYQLRVSNTR